MRSTGRPLTPYRSAAVLASALLLASCGGGSGSRTAPPAPVAPAAPVKADASGVLKLQFPPKVAIAKDMSTATARRPKFVNPNTGYVIDIYVDGVLAPNLDGLAGAGDSIQVTTASGDGTQTATIPLVSTNPNQIVAIEWDNTSHADVVAIGENDFGTINPGQVVTLQLTMAMNAEYLVIAADATGTNAQAQIGFEDEFGPPGLGYGVGPLECPANPAPAAQNTFFLFEADISQSFIPVAGYSGTIAPAISPQVVPGTSHVGTNSAGGFFISFDSSGDAPLLLVTGHNPAWDQLGRPGIAYLQSHGVSLVTIALEDLGVYVTPQVRDGC